MDWYFEYEKTLNLIWYEKTLNSIWYFEYEKTLNLIWYLNMRKL